MEDMIKDATHADVSALCQAMNAAFSDYPVPMHLSQQGFEFRMRMRGYRPEHSRIAMIGGAVAAFWLVGVRGDKAYLISSGTLPAYRRRGLSKAIGRAVIATLKDNGITSIQTEVLANNPSAQALYAQLGFSVMRELDSFDLQTAALTCVTHERIQQAAIPTERLVRPLWETHPSWQDDIAAHAAVARDVRCFAINDEIGLAAYVIFNPQTENLSQIAVRPDKRRQGLATALITHGKNVLDLPVLKVINVDRANVSLLAFLKVSGAEPLVSQMELARRF